MVKWFRPVAMFALCAFAGPSIWAQPSVGLGHRFSQRAYRSDGQTYVVGVQPEYLVVRSDVHTEGELTTMVQARPSR